MKILVILWFISLSSLACEINQTEHKTTKDQLIEYIYTSNKSEFANLWQQIKDPNQKNDKFFLSNQDESNINDECIGLINNKNYTLNEVRDKKNMVCGLLIASGNVFILETLYRIFGADCSNYWPLKKSPYIFTMLCSGGSFWYYVTKEDALNTQLQKLKEIKKIIENKNEN